MGPSSMALSPPGTGPGAPVRKHRRTKPPLSMTLPPATTAGKSSSGLKRSGSSALGAGSTGSGGSGGGAVVEGDVAAPALRKRRHAMTVALKTLAEDDALSGSDSEMPQAGSGQQGRQQGFGPAAGLGRNGSGSHEDGAGQAAAAGISRGGVISPALQVQLAAFLHLVCTSDSRALAEKAGYPKVRDAGAWSG